MTTPSSSLADEQRCHKLVEESVRKFDLDLSGLTILTEAATGYYAMTAMIAGRAGARVLAVTRDSRYGKARDVASALLDLAGRWSLAPAIEVLPSRDDARVAHADIVTNLGFVRPLDAPFVSRLNAGAVIPLMWETWEFRSEDLDLAACRSLQIPVLGTNEHHPSLRTMDYVGAIALKLLCSLDVEPIGSRIAVIGSGEFADSVDRLLSALGSSVVRLEPREGRWQLDATGRSALSSADALVVAEHHSRRELIGRDGYVSAEALFDLNPAIAIAHICGSVEHAPIDALGFRYAPARFAPAGYMSVATDHVGPRPIIELHAAGLKVGAVMHRFRRDGLSGFDAEMATLQATDLAQGFAGYHTR
jgi:hypothetical protein